MSRIERPTYNNVRNCLSFCSVKIPIYLRVRTFNVFWDNPRQSQDLIIGSMMKPQRVAQKKVAPKSGQFEHVTTRKNRFSLYHWHNLRSESPDCARSWKYEIEGQKVCQSAILKLLQIKPKRLRIVRGKILHGSTDFRERIGGNYRIPKKTWDIARAHLTEIPRKTSHYTKSQMNYFSDTTLTVGKIFESFRAFYAKQPVIASMKIT